MKQVISHWFHNKEPGVQSHEIRGVRSGIRAGFPQSLFGSPC
jgi:hypothetical protein